MRQARLDREMLRPMARLALHMNAARPPCRAEAREPLRLWRWWMNCALMVLASTGIAVLVWQILRRGL